MAKRQPEVSKPKTAQEIELRYVTGPRITQQELMGWSGRSERYIAGLSIKRELVRRRSEFLQAQTEIATESAKSDLSGRVEKFHTKVVDLAEAIIDRALELARGKKMSSYQLSQISTTAKNAIQAGHLAVGEATTVLKTIDTELAKIAEGLEDGLDEAI